MVVIVEHIKRRWHAYAGIAWGAGSAALFYVDQNFGTLQGALAQFFPKWAQTWIPLGGMGIGISVAVLKADMVADALKRKFGNGNQ